MTKKIMLTSLLSVAALTLVACGNSSSKTASAELKDGKYTVESNFDERGYKVVHTLTVSEGKITESNFGYQKEDGSWKADDAAYNETMKAKAGVSSKEATEQLNKALVEKQNISDVEAVSGATSTSTNFKASTEALLKAASEGKTETVKIELGK